MKSLTLPESITAALSHHDAIVSISISGGKDSQAMQRALLSQIDAAQIDIVHADLGRAEWPQTPDFVQRMGLEADRPVAIVQRAKGDLVQRIEERMESLTDDDGNVSKPFWPSSAQRYCTSDLKRGPIQKHQRALCKDGIIISCAGIRAEESSNRAKQPAVKVAKELTSKPYKDLEPAAAVAAWVAAGRKGRVVLFWLPIHDWSAADVWDALGTTEDDLERRRSLYRDGRGAEALSGWQAHPAYVLGNDRLSCALCVLATVGDLCNGRDHHPELFAHYVAMEQRTGYSFKHGQSLQDLPENPNSATAPAETCGATCQLVLFD